MDIERWQLVRTTYTDIYLSGVSLTLLIYQVVHFLCVVERQTGILRGLFTPINLC